MNKTSKIITSVVAGTLLTAAAVVAMAGPDKIANHFKSEAVLAAQVSLQQATDLATAQIPGTVVDSEIEQENGTLVWDLELLASNNDHYEFEINANTGEILKQKLDSDKDDDDDDDDDDRDDKGDRDDDDQYDKKDSH